MNFAKFSTTQRIEDALLIVWFTTASIIAHMPGAMHSTMTATKMNSKISMVMALSINNFPLEQTDSTNTNIYKV